MFAVSSVFQQQMLVRNWSYVILSNIEGWIYCKRAIFDWVTAKTLQVIKFPPICRQDTKWFRCYTNISDESRFFCCSLVSDFLLKFGTVDHHAHNFPTCFSCNSRRFDFLLGLLLAVDFVASAQYAGGVCKPTKIIFNDFVHNLTSV